MTTTNFSLRHPVLRVSSAIAIAALTSLITFVSIAPEAAADNPAPVTTVGTSGTSGAAVLPSGIPAPPDLDVSDASRRNMIIDPAKVPAVTPKVTLVSSWPVTGAELWVPLREARLTFDTAVRPVDVTVQIYQKDDQANALVKRTVVDPDLKTVRFSVQGITPGDWIVVWQAGETQGLFPFKMNTPPRAMGGQNHREHAPSTPNSRLASSLALGFFPLLAGLSLLSRRSRRVDVARIATGVVATAAAVMTAALNVVTTTSAEFATSLATATVWSWVALAAASLALILRTTMVRAIALTAFGIGVIGTVPRELPLADSMLTGGISLALAALAVIVVYLAVTSLQGQRWPLLLKIAAAGSMGGLGVLMAFVANSFDKPTGLFIAEYQDRIVASAVLTVSLLLTFPKLGQWLSMGSIAKVESPDTTQPDSEAADVPYTGNNIEIDVENGDELTAVSTDQSNDGENAENASADVPSKTAGILDRADALIEKSMKGGVRVLGRAAKWFVRTVVRTVVRAVVLVTITGGLVYALVTLLSVPTGGAGL